jgi:hypothetical protein
MSVSCLCVCRVFDDADSSYEALANVTSLRYLPSRSNTIATQLLSARDAARAASFVRTYGAWSDVKCQGVSRCRQQARSFPTLVNASEFAASFARAALHVVAQWPCLRGKPPPATRIRRLRVARSRRPAVGSLALPGGNERIAVVIVGQLSRLEIQSKVHAEIRSKRTSGALPLSAG